MATLYEIDQAILECVDTETGEIIDAERLADLHMERETKIESVALWYKNLLSDAEAYKAEKNAFAEREKRAREKAESLKQWLANSLAGEKFKTARVGISYRKSDSLVVDNIYAVDERFVKYVEPTADAMAIKAAIKAGEIVNGCHLEFKTNIQIR